VRSTVRVLLDVASLAVFDCNAVDADLGGTAFIGSVGCCDGFEWMVVDDAAFEEGNSMIG
jgi:uncharacterized protein (DUF779 family)